MVIGVVSTLVLTSCSRGPDGGQSLSEAAAGGESIPGVASAEVLSQTVSTAPFERAQRADIRLTLEPGWAVDNAPELLRWALATAWSLHDAPIDYGLIMSIGSPDGRLPVDWEAAAAETGIPDGWDGDTSYDDHGFVAFRSEDIAAVVQEPWPTDPPPVPADAFAVAWN